MKKKTTYDLRTERMDYIFDTHAHYDDEAFDADREEVLTGLKEQGIGTVVNVGASIASTKTTLALAEAHPFTTDQLVFKQLLYAGKVRFALFRIKFRQTHTTLGRVQRT